MSSVENGDPGLEGVEICRFGWRSCRSIVALQVLCLLVGRGLCSIEKDEIRVALNNLHSIKLEVMVR